MSDIRNARNVVVAAYLGWTLDAFDFFIMIFVFDDVAKTFGVGLTIASLAITLTLLMRAFGALIFGRLADRYGRRPIMMFNIICFAGLELLSGLAPTLLAFMVLRALFGIAMGGEWGVGSSLTMETIPAKWRGWVSGLLQAGYPSGYLLATIAYGVLFPLIGWRGLFIIGALPALLVIYIRRNVPESPDWHARQKAPRVPIMDVLRRNAGLTVYAVILMTAFNFFSHGTQDIYPKAFLKVQRRDSRRPHLRLDLADDRSASRHRHRGRALPAGHPAVGLFVLAVVDRPRRLSDAVHGSGCLGRHSRPSQRTVARRDPWHLSGLRLSAWQLPRLL
jgi:SHS family lactate transporter-like MFS transporter